MGAILSVLIAFLSLVWAGLMLITVAAPLFRRRPKKYSTESQGARVLVMVPCKGSEINLEENLRSLKAQDYRNFNVVVIVDSKTDSAVRAAKKADVRFIVSSKKYRECSGKVAAIITAMKRNPDYDIYVNIDSDVRCSKSHIRELVAPLSDKRVGASTAYAYFMPVSGFWSSVAMVWGFVGNGMMESDLTKFVWGGSMAFRKELVGKKEFAVFERALSDDISISYFVTQRGLSISYVDSGSATVMVKESFSSFWRWANRQTAWSLLRSGKVLYYGLAFYGAQIALLLSGVALALAVSPFLLVLLLPFAIGVLKSCMRATKNRLLSIPISMMIDFVFLANLVSASKMRRMEWRGRIYKLRNRGA